MQVGIGFNRLTLVEQRRVLEGGVLQGNSKATDRLYDKYIANLGRGGKREREARDAPKQPPRYPSLQAREVEPEPLPEAPIVPLTPAEKGFPYTFNTHQMRAIKTPSTGLAHGQATWPFPVDGRDSHHSLAWVW
eukprot:TRINITY_DN4753_c2_g1_i1.p1 TRINITY_DN4753_c2_g1~~TRINITY_DN4753_c2_g1_i1.p1  ORF type:complete len:134 (+),score=18.34 TRINITY_DN4753_c2_g1_i1:136-537(+)